ncbi:MAG: hypothetical protein RLZZ344_255 [Pseudomonadota bacterium]
MAGRFAPSPTGPLHQGSLATALASYLDAKAHAMPWWVRMEDLDPPREVPGAADQILSQLIAHGLVWDPWPAEHGGRTNGVLYQSDRAKKASAYTDALGRLVGQRMAFRCRCSRSRLAAYRADSALTPNAPNGDDTEPLYPGYCRPPAPAVPESERHAWRFCSPQAVEAVTGHRVTDDAMQAEIAAEPGAEDNFVIRRADGLWAYHLAVVVDDAFQGVTRIVRGSDLGSALPRHRQLQIALGLDGPPVVHVPVVVNASGQKLSKQTQAPALGSRPKDVAHQRQEAWEHLRLQMPADWVRRVRPLAEIWLGVRLT